MIKIKEPGFKFDKPNEDVADITYELSLNRAHIYLNPLIYCHLVNMSEVFSRPLASSGDAQKLKHNERKHIFQEATRYEMVRKKGNTIRWWYDYIAVFSGSYIYFFPWEDRAVIEEIMEFYRLEAGDASGLSQADPSLSRGGPGLGEPPALERRRTVAFGAEANKVQQEEQG